MRLMVYKYMFRHDQGAGVPAIDSIFSNAIGTYQSNVTPGTTLPGGSNTLNTYAQAMVDIRKNYPATNAFYKCTSRRSFVLAPGASATIKDTWQHTFNRFYLDNLQSAGNIAYLKGCTYFLIFKLVGFPATVTSSGASGTDNVGATAPVNVDWFCDHTWGGRVSRGFMSSHVTQYVDNATAASTGYASDSLHTVYVGGSTIGTVTTTAIQAPGGPVTILNPTPAGGTIPIVVPT